MPHPAQMKIILYKEYDHALWMRYVWRKKYDEVLTEQEELFQMTQPKGFDLTKDKVSGGDASDTFNSYLMAKDKHHIDERREEANHYYEIWDAEVKKREAELRSSKDIKDRIYVMWFLDRKKVWQIARTINYSKQHTYRLLEDIRLTLRVR